MKLFRMELTPPLAAISAALMILATSTASALTIEVNNVQQRYPWNGIVDIDYTLEYGEGETLDPTCDRLMLVVKKGGVTYPAWHINSCAGLATGAGSHRAVWEANADGVDFASSDVTVRIELRKYNPYYMVVNLSEGSTATSYSIEYCAEPPQTEGGFNADAYKGDKLVLRLVPPGSFKMGVSGKTDHTAPHNVTLSHPFYIGLFEMTKLQQMKINGGTVAAGKDFLPASYVSYSGLRGGTKGLTWPESNEVDAATPLGRLRARTGLDFDIPLEAEWEYACRAGTTTTYNDGRATVAKENVLLLGCFKENCGKASPGTDDGLYACVGSFLANNWGLYDMHGNVVEFCRDRYLAAALPDAVDPVGDKGATNYPLRGGSFYESYAAAASGTCGLNYHSTRTYGFCGYRVSVTMPSDYCPDGFMTVTTFGEKDATLDLSSVWDKRDIEAEPIAYSTCGWDVDLAEDSGKTVTLTLAPLEGEEVPQTLATELSGRDVFAWTPSGFQQKVYRLDHLVYNAKGAALPKETLTATYSFLANPYARVTDAAVRAAMSAPTSEDFVFDNDAVNQWKPIDGAGNGVRAQSGVESELSFTVSGIGSFSFDSILNDATVTVKVDGAVVDPPSASASWTSSVLTLAARGTHTISFVATPGASGLVALRNIRWLTCDASYGVVAADAVRVDLRTGVRRVIRRSDILPFAASSTNFVGITGATDASIAKVSLVELTGDAGADVSLWTVEKSGTEKLLLAEAGERTVVWKRAQPGVWKATFEILTGAKSVHQETALFDLRDLRVPGTAIYLR